MCIPFRSALSIENNLQLRAAKRKRQQHEINEQELLSWKPIDITKEHFMLKSVPETLHKATFKPDIRKSFLDILLAFFPVDFIEDIWHSYPIDHWAYTTAGECIVLFAGRPHVGSIYLYLAMYIAICGTGRTHHKRQRPLREDIQDCIDTFQLMAPEGIRIPGRETFELLFARFLLSRDHMAELCANFRSILSHIGRVLACDEKLFHFTGNSAYIRLIPQKLGVGIWIYDATCVLENGDPYLVHCKQSVSLPAKQIKEPVVGIVKEWFSLSKEFSTKDNYIGPVVTYDSYYNVEETRQLARTTGTPFVAAVMPSRFGNLIAILRRIGTKVAKPGDTAAEERGELFVNHWDIDPKKGKKFCLSNAFVERPSLRSGDFIVPVYDHYDLMYRGCDQFHRLLSDTLFPHKAGGKNTPGEFGSIHRFLMAVALKNIFSAVRNIGGHSEEETDFPNCCRLLSNSLAAHAFTLM